MHAHTHEDCATLNRQQLLQASRERQGEEACDCGSFFQGAQNHLLGSQGREGIQGVHGLRSGISLDNCSEYSGFVKLIDGFPGREFACVIMRV